MDIIILPTLQMKKLNFRIYFKGSYLDSIFPSVQYYIYVCVLWNVVEWNGM